MNPFNLTDPDPSYRRYLHDHQVHSRKRGVVRNGFTYVENYNYPFIRAEDTPVWVWPVNAADWGLIEYLPSQSDMRPPENPRHVVGHPALNHNGDIHLVHGPLFSAFCYWPPEGEPKCSSRRSCRITHWRIDPASSDAIVDTCWGCRRMGRKCSIQGMRIPRKYIHGVPIGREEDQKPFPGFVRPKFPPEWRDIPSFRVKELLAAYRRKQQGPPIADDAKHRARDRPRGHRGERRHSMGKGGSGSSVRRRRNQDSSRDDSSSDSATDGTDKTHTKNRNARRGASHQSVSSDGDGGSNTHRHGVADSGHRWGQGRLLKSRQLKSSERSNRGRSPRSSSSEDLDPLRDRRRDVNGEDDENVMASARGNGTPTRRRQGASMSVKREPESPRTSSNPAAGGRKFGRGVLPLTQGSTGSSSNPINAEYDWAGAANTLADAIEIEDSGDDADDETADQAAG